MSSELLSSIAGIILSLAFAYIPKLKDWFNGQSSQGKAGVMAVALIIVAAASFSLSCFGLGADLGLTLYCSKADAINLAKNLIFALMANQAAFKLFVSPFQKS